jgi:hypothetical protein
LTTICSLEADLMHLRSSVRWTKTRRKRAKFRIYNIQTFSLSLVQTWLDPIICMVSTNIHLVKVDTLSLLSLSRYWPSKKYNSNRHVKHNWNNSTRIEIWTVAVGKTSNVISINLPKELVVPRITINLLWTTTKTTEASC